MKQSAFVKKIGLNKVILIIVMILIFIFFSIMTPILQNGSSFLQFSRILSICNYASFLGFLALGVTFVIATGGIDFSIGPVMFAAALISGYCMTKFRVSLPLCIIICILIGTLFGTLNGYLVAFHNLPSFITSMASMQIAKGVASVLTSANSVSWPKEGINSGYRFLVRAGNVPIGLILLGLTAVISEIVLNNTMLGRYILSLGSNKEAVRLSGVNTKKYEMLAYIFCGILAGFAALFYVAAYTTVQPGLGDNFNNDAIASCVMGGASMSGGLASMIGTTFGTLTISLLQEGILALGFNKDYQYVLTGLIVLVAVLMDMRSKKNSR